MMHAGNTDEDPRLRNLANRKITSGLLLMQLIYYHLFYDVAWLMFWLIFIIYQYWEGLWFSDPDIVRTVMFILFLIFEPIRLVAGWFGNVYENVPWLVLFVLLTIFPLMAPVLYLLIGTFRRNSLTRAVQISQILMFLSELGVGIFTIFRMYKLQKQQYYLFEYVMNQRRRDAAYRIQAGQPNRRGSPGRGTGGIGSRR